MHTAHWVPAKREVISRGNQSKKIIVLQNVVVFSGHNYKKNDNGAVRGGREKGQQIFSLQNMRKKKLLALSRLQTHAVTNTSVWPAESVRVLQYKKIGIVFQLVSLRWVRYSLCDRR